MTWLRLTENAEGYIKPDMAMSMDDIRTFISH